MTQVLITMIMMVAAVRAEALANYDTNGWDTVVECWSDAEIEEVLVENNCKTELEAITAMRDEIAPFAAYRKDIEGTAF